MLAILLVGPFRTPDNPVGGVSTFLVNLQESILGKRYNLIPFTTLRPINGPRRTDGYNSLFRAGLRGAIRSAAVTMCHLIKFPFVVIGLRPAIVQVHSSSLWTFWESGCYVLMARLLGRKVVLRYGGAMPTFFTEAGRLQQWAIRLILRTPNRMIVQSERWKQFFIEYVDISKLVVLPNSVEIERFIRENRLFTPKKCEVLFMGGDEAIRKGLKDVVSILSEMLEANPYITFHLVADPDDILPGLPETVKDRLRISPLLDNTEVVKAYHEADIFILPSYGEGFPNSILEAMAAGLPIVSTSVGAIPEVITNGQCGFIIEPGNRIALKNRLLMLAENVRSRQKMSMNNVSKVKRFYSRDEVFQVLDSLYKEIT